MENQPFVFISYSRKDTIFVDKLINDLNSEGINTWIDVQQISPGEMWQDEIKRGIERSSLMIVILSTNYLSSSWTSIELAFALNKPILSIKISEDLPDSLPNILKSLQWIDFHKDYNRAIDLLLKSIPQNFKGNKPIKAQAAKSKGYVFLSFSEKDTAFIIILRKFLKSQDFAYWDFEEGNRNYHTQFFLELESVINDSEAVLSIISEDWKKSSWSIREFFYSEEIGKPVLLCKVKKYKPILAIAGLPYIDFSLNKNIGFKKLEKELKKRLN